MSNDNQNDYTSPEMFIADVADDYHYSDNIKIENVDATEDESMAVEALRELGNSTGIFLNSACIETKTPFDLPSLPCPTCNLQFRTTADLQNHSSICTASQHKCQICGELFDRKTDLNNHLVCHAVDRPHSCRMCGTLFIYKKDLLEHAATHGSKHINQCQVCGVTFSRPSSLTNHMKIHTYQPGRATVAFVKASRDLEAEGSESNEEVGGERPLPSLNAWILNSEVNDCDDPINNSQVPGIKSEATEAKDPGKPHTCQYCHKTFHREKALLSHLKLHEALLDNIYQCDGCDRFFSDDLALADHSCANKKKKAQTQALSPEDIERLRSLNRVCTECDKVFPTKQKLQRHMWIHRKKVIMCEICSITFTSQDFLDSHRLAKHQRESAFSCQECGKNFSSRQGLWEHSRVHGPCPLFKCEECNKTFSSRQGYLIHKRKHSDERPYGCRFCWKAFRDGGTLRKHELIHTGERPHVCPICSRAFNQKVVLREHVRWLHTANKEPDNEGKFPCVLCEISVSDKDELCAHIVRHSDQRALAARDASKSNIKAKVCMEKNTKVECSEPITAGSVMCDLCGKTFSDRYELTAHVGVHI